MTFSKHTNAVGKLNVNLPNTKQSRWNGNIWHPAHNRSLPNAPFPSFSDWPTGWTIRGFNSRNRQESSCSRKLPDQLRGTPHLPFKGYREQFQRRQRDQGVKRTTEPRLRMSASIPLFLQVFMTWTKTTWYGQNERKVICYHHSGKYVRRTFGKMIRCSKIKTIPVLIPWRHMEWSYRSTHS